LRDGFELDVALGSIGGLAENWHGLTLSWSVFQRVSMFRTSFDRVRLSTLLRVNLFEGTNRTLKFIAYGWG
jgi:hypothetical protein